MEEGDLSYHNIPFQVKFISIILIFSSKHILQFLTHLIQDH